MLKPFGFALAGMGALLALLAAGVWLLAPGPDAPPPHPGLPKDGLIPSTARSPRFPSGPSTPASAGNPLLRRSHASDAEILAGVRAWGKSDLEAAVAWALRSNPADRQRYLEAALIGGTIHPDRVREVGRKLLANPASGEADGTLVAGALTGAGQFEAAVQFATESASPSREDWLRAAVTRWSQTDPESAAQALAVISEENLRHSAFEAMVKGWADEKAPALAEYALTLPRKDRTDALDAAFDKWSLQDPAALGAWLGEFERSPELDPAISLLVTRTDGANRSREVALAWAQIISDPDLRYASVAHVVEEWARTDRPAARSYVASAPGLSPAQRKKLTQALNTPP